MAGYRPYPEYKDSGVEWLGTVPTHWGVKRVKNLATCNDESLDERTDPDFEMEYVDISRVNLIDGITTTEVLSFEEAPSRARRKVKDGDTIISTVRTYLKAIAPIKEPPGNLVVSTGFAVIRPKPGIDSSYLGYLLQSEGFVGDVVANSVGVSYPAINASVLAALPAVEPDIEEQQTIARFLDHKTAQIDALIAKKEELLEKVAEKRTALISHVVTKGLNPNAKMKDSGVEWLGEVPEHWEVIRLRFVVSKIEQGWSPQCENQPADEDEWGVLKVGCVNGEDFDFLENKALPGGLQPKTEYEIKAGDILMSRANTKELLGSAALVHEVRSKLILCDKLYRFISGGNISNRYLVHVLRSSLSRYQYEREATGASGSMQNIGQDTVKNLTFALPPLEEQLEIEGQLETILSRVESTKELVTAAILQLKEYRSALITQAVTGKIDVRNIQILKVAAKGEAA